MAKKQRFRPGDRIMVSRNLNRLNCNSDKTEVGRCGVVNRLHPDDVDDWVEITLDKTLTDPPFTVWYNTSGLSAEPPDTVIRQIPIWSEA